MFPNTLLRETQSQIINRSGSS